MDCKRLTQIPGVFSCQLCIEINDSFTCYILENSSNSAANTALTDLREGTYFYRVTVFLDDVPVASTYDFFSTCKHISLLDNACIMILCNCMILLSVLSLRMRIKVRFISTIHVLYILIGAHRANTP